MGRVFTLEEARELLPRIQALTEPVHQLAESFAEELAEVERSGDQRRVEELQERLQSLVESWSESVRDCGAEVKGLWLVDFDSGTGYWCWVYPERELGRWHSYHGGVGASQPFEEGVDRP